MSKFKNQAANSLALLFIVPFAAGVVHAAEPMAEKKLPPPPTIDTNKDGKADAWDRDANGIPDAWDINDDGKPDLRDNNGDGKPDDGKTAPPAEGSAEPDNQ